MNDNNQTSFLNIENIKTGFKSFKKWAEDKPVLKIIFNSRPKVVVIRLSGVIMESTKSRPRTINYNQYAQVIDKAFDNTEANAVVLIINSPGGSPAQSALIGGHIRARAEEEDKPVYAFVEDVAASGGYWLACAADEIFALSVSIVGSIGVISASFGFNELIGRYGVERRVYTSGKEKAFMDPFSETKPEDIKRLKKIQKDLHKSFIAWVKDRRGNYLNGSDSALFEGQFWTGDEAIKNGIIDEIGDIRTVLQERFGKKVKMIEIEPHKSLFSLPMINGKIDHDADGVFETMQEKQILGQYGL